jgi:hypothetical protein
MEISVLKTTAYGDFPEKYGLQNTNDAQFHTAIRQSAIGTGIFSRPAQPKLQSQRLHRTRKPRICVAGLLQPLPALRLGCSHR